MDNEQTIAIIHYSLVTLFPSRTVALELFGLQIHWYGLMYLLGFLLAFWMLPRLQKFRGLTLTREEWSSLLSWGILGVLVGGRLGYVVFYEPTYFLFAPWEIFAVWQGGMSSHGGFLGVCLAFFYALRKRRDEFLRFADVLVVPIAIGLALGRLGNFINQELYGIPTTLSWGIIIPGEEGLRHPTQIYAVFKDLCIAAVCFWHLRQCSLPLWGRVSHSAPSSWPRGERGVQPGKTLALFFMLYGILRFLLEYLRVQDYPLIDTGVLLLSRGQILTLPIILLGVWLWFRRK